MQKCYVVQLVPEERGELLELAKRGKVSARKLNRAHILLLADEGRTDRAIADALHTGHATVGRVRRRFAEEGLEAALCERPRAGGKPKLDGRQEAYLLALASSGPPRGKRRWTMQMLADRMVELNIVDSISDETVRRALKRGT